MAAEGLLSVVTSPSCLILIVIGVIIGIIFGAIPGLSANMAIVLFLPMTFGMEPIQGISTLLALYVGAVSGGLISAILLKIPGTPSSIATVFDGGPMADRGEAGKALGIGILYSFIGGLFSAAMLIFLAKPLANVALKFTSAEYFSIAVFSLTIIAGLSGDSVVNGLISGVFGMLIASVGRAPIDGYSRYTFGIRAMSGGFATVPVLIGLFAVVDIINSAYKKSTLGVGTIKTYKMKGFGVSFQEFRAQFWNMIKSAVVGLVVGILPGVGGSTSSIMAYSVSKNTSKHPERYGTGCIDGIVASETSNNATTGGALIPMLALGIPGNAATALLLGGLTVYGISPGPLVFQRSGVFVYGAFAAFALANVVMLVVEYCGLSGFVKLLKVPKYVLYPIIMVMCAIGAFGGNSRIFDVQSIFLFGMIAFIFKSVKIPTTPMIIGYILAPLAEQNLRRALQASDGSWSIFFTRPISAAFLIIAVLSLVYCLWRNYRTQKTLKATMAENEDLVKKMEEDADE